MNNNLGETMKLSKGGGCGCGGTQLGFPQAGGFGFAKMRSRRKKKMKAMKGIDLLSIAQANPDGFQTLCSIMPVATGGQSNTNATASNSNSSGEAKPKMKSRMGRMKSMMSRKKSMPFPLNLLAQPSQVQQVCAKIAANPDILTAPIASEVPTTNGATVQEHLNVLHAEAETAPTSGNSVGGDIFGLFGPNAPNSKNIIANNGRTVGQHIQELHEEIEGGRRRTKKKRSTKRSKKTRRNKKMRTK